jgi:hypothetical protein
MSALQFDRTRRAQLTTALGVVAATVVVDHLFTVVAGPEGLLAPFGPVHLAALALGFTTLGLRLVVTFVLVPLTVWRLTGNQPAPQTSSSGTKR